MNHWITRAVTKARLNQSLEHLTAEWEVKGLIPGGRTNTKGLQKKKKLGNEGIAFALQTARPSHDLDDYVKWRSRLQYNTWLQCPQVIL